MLGETSETAALNEARDSDGGAAAALNVAAGLGGDRVVGVEPDRPRRPSRRVAADGALAPSRHERIVHRDLVHGAGPDQQGVRGVRGALITVASAFDDQAQMVLAREVDRGGDVISISGGDRINAGLGGPGIGPTRWSA